VRNLKESLDLFLMGLLFFGNVSVVCDGLSARISKRKGVQSIFTPTLRLQGWQNVLEQNRTKGIRHICRARLRFCGSRAPEGGEAHTALLCEVENYLLFSHPLSSIILLIYTDCLLSKIAIPFTSSSVK